MKPSISRKVTRSKSAESVGSNKSKCSISSFFSTLSSSSPRNTPASSSNNNNNNGNRFSSGLSSEPDVEEELNSPPNAIELSDNAEEDSHCCSSSTRTANANAKATPWDNLRKIVGVEKTPFLYSKQDEIELTETQATVDDPNVHRLQWQNGCTQTYEAEEGILKSTGTVGNTTSSDPLLLRSTALTVLAIAGMGTTTRKLATSFSATNSRKNRRNKKPKFSLKRLTNDANNEQTRSFQLEALYLSVLYHPNLPKLYAVSSVKSGSNGCSGSSLFMLTGYVHETLQDRIRLFKMTPSKNSSSASASNSRAKRRSKQQLERDSYPEDLLVLKVNYALQIADALQYLHARGIVVRTLTPATIGFKGRQGHTIQLLDLSHAKELQQHKRSLPSDIPVVVPPPPPDWDVTPSAFASTTSSGDSMPFSESSSYDASPFDNDLCSRSLGQQFPPTERLIAQVESKDNTHDIQYRAPELYFHYGIRSDNANSSYSTKADVYSWSMISYHLFTDALPYGKEQRSDYEHLQHVDTNGRARPDLQLKGQSKNSKSKKHLQNSTGIPRSLQIILEHAWAADHKYKRWSSQQVEKAVVSVLDMLEGRGLPWSNGSSASIPGQETKSQKKRQQLNLSRTCNTTSKTMSLWQGESLPERAVQLVKQQQKDSDLGCNGTTSWSQVWDDNQ